MHATNSFFPFHPADEFDNERILDLLERNGDELCAILEIVACSPAVDNFAVIAAALERSDEAAAEIFYALTDLRMTLDGLIAEQGYEDFAEGARRGTGTHEQGGAKPL